MKTFLPKTANVVIILMAVLMLAACGGGGGDDTTAPTGPFQLTLSLDASFQAPHGGQPISVALVRQADSVIVAQTNGTVSASQGPSFTFSTGPVMDKGFTYELHYWIDSNIGGGTPGVCDPKEIDHQWSTEFLSVGNDINFTTSYEPGLIEDVCSTFM